jgi:pilus assembly protein CpaF
VSARRAEESALEEVRSELVRRGGVPGPAAIAAAVRATGRVRGDREVLALVGALQAELTGAGPLQQLLDRPGVTDVLVNAPDEVWVDRGAGLEPTDVRFADEFAVRHLAQRLAAQAGRRLDEASPWVDARLPDGARLHAILPPVAVRGTTISLRVPPQRAFTLDSLVEAGTVPSSGAVLLRRLVRCRAAFLLSGGTGSGKTTMLSCLLGEVAPDERIVVVEDSRELAPDHPHVVGLQARPPNVEGSGAVCLADLVRQALRMRPDRLVVGEVRGAEVVDLLAAMNTGHEGGCGTVHANSAADVPARIEALAGSAGLGREAAHSQLAAALDVVVHLVRSAGRRRVADVHVLHRSAAGLVETLPAITFPAGGSSVAGPGADRLHDLLTRADR